MTLLLNTEILWSEVAPSSAGTLGTLKLPQRSEGKTYRASDLTGQAKSKDEWEKTEDFPDGRDRACPLARAHYGADETSL